MQKRTEDFDARLASATTDIQAEKDASEALAKTKTDELTAELEAMKKQSDDRFRIGSNWRRRAAELETKVKENENQLADLTAKSEQSGTVSTDLASTSKELEDARMEVLDRQTELEGVKKRIEDLDKELSETKTKLTEAERKLSESEKGSHVKDMTVSRLQAEMAKAQTHPSTLPLDASVLVRDIISFDLTGSSYAQAELRTEKERLQAELDQAKKDLETAKASATASTDDPAPSNTDERQVELQKRIDALEKERAEQDEVSRQEHEF